MKRWLASMVVVLGLLALMACAAEKEVAPATPGPEVAPAWQEEWDRLLAAAKGEGRVAVAGPVGAELRRALTEPFEKRYGITVEYLGHSGADLMPRIRAEREAGQYLWDVFMGGATYGFTTFRDLKALEPIEPALILSEVKDPKNWRGEGLYFADKDRKVLGQTVYTSGTWFVNRSLVKTEEFKSWKDLLDPKWKGKVLMHDPKVPGTGAARVLFFYMHPELGMDFIRALAPQLVLSRDYAQQLEWVAAGRYPILIGGYETLGYEKVKEGLPIAILSPGQLREGGHLATGVNALMLLSRAPHPNATKVYVNWLLGREGQTELSRASGLPSWRVDVPTDHIEPAKMPKPTYISTVGEEAEVLKRDKMPQVLAEVFGR